MSRIRVWPTEFLEPGDSFSFPVDKYNSAIQSMRNARLKYPGRLFITSGGLEPWVRMWRIDSVPNEVVEIDRGIPIPAREMLSMYPLKEMQVGDSFVINDIGAQKTIQEQCSRYKRKGLGTFRVLRINGSLSQWRCWRTK